MTAGPARLLIVDDEAAQLRALCDTLQLEGFLTEGFSSARQALAELRPGEVDLLLTDLMMPEMDGISLINAARQIDPALGAIVMTAMGPSTRRYRPCGGRARLHSQTVQLNVILPLSHERWTCSGCGAKTPSCASANDGRPRKSPPRITTWSLLVLHLARSAGAAALDRRLLEDSGG